MHFLGFLPEFFGTMFIYAGRVEEDLIWLSSISNWSMRLWIFSSWKLYRSWPPAYSGIPSGWLNLIYAKLQHTLSWKVMCWKLNLWDFWPNLQATKQALTWRMRYLIKTVSFRWMAATAILISYLSAWRTTQYARTSWKRLAASMLLYPGHSRTMMVHILTVIHD